MSPRYAFAGFFLAAGCAGMALVLSAMAFSLQLDAGQDLFFAMAGLGGGALSLLLGLFILFTRR